MPGGARGLAPVLALDLARRARRPGLVERLTDASGGRSRDAGSRCARRARADPDAPASSAASPVSPVAATASRGGRGSPPDR